jgi:hypothetical protein
MKKDKKELEKNAASAQPAPAATTVKEQPAANRSQDTSFLFSRYAFDTAGGGYQGL